jgi:hypothetical protein
MVYCIYCYGTACVEDALFYLNYINGSFEIPYLFDVCVREGPV